MDFEKKAVCRKVAKVFELAAMKGYEPIAFTKLWFNSIVALKLYQFDFNLIAQGKPYLLHSIELEYNIDDNYCSEENIKYSELMFFTGYALSYYIFEKNILPKELIQQYDFINFMKRYETLHTLSITHALEYLEKI